MDKDDVDEREALLEVYMRALGMIPDFEPELPLGDGGAKMAALAAGLGAVVGVEGTLKVIRETVGEAA
jgi:hypothetical protein